MVPRGARHHTCHGKGRLRQDHRRAATGSAQPLGPDLHRRSWIAAKWGKPIRLLPWLRERIDERYPGTKLGITEYDFGAGDHISGGLAVADALGAFGREGVYLANYWGESAGNGELPKFVKSAFKLYRNYDGKQGAFGDTAVTASGDLGKSSIYAAIDSKHRGVLTVLVINKDLRARFDARIALNDAATSVPRSIGSRAARRRSTRSRPSRSPAGRLRPGCRPSATLFVCRK